VNVTAYINKGMNISLNTTVPLLQQNLSFEPSNLFRPKLGHLQARNEL